MAATLTQTGKRKEHPGGRQLWLDVIRGVAVLMVLGAHSAVPPDQAGWLRPLAAFWVRIGWTGVDLFFVLSGFLVSGLLFEEFRRTGRMDSRRFLIRRAFKIWPSYYVYLLFLFGLLWASQGTPPVRRILPNLLHLQNYLGSARIHTWSLAVEEHFYLALPLLLLLLLRKRQPRDTSQAAGPTRPRAALSLLPPVAAGVVALCLGLRLLAVCTSVVDWRTNFFPTHLRADALFFGVLLGYLKHFRPQAFARLRGKRIVLLGAALVAPVFVLGLGTPFVNSVGFTLLYLGFGCFVAAASQREEPARPTRRLWQPLGFIGFYSYTIYLWHFDLTRPLLTRLWQSSRLMFLPPEAAWLAVMALYIGLAILVGFVAGRLVEKPALRLRERLFPSARARPENNGNNVPVGEPAASAEQMPRRAAVSSGRT